MKHEEQRAHWEEEHRTSAVLKAMDSKDPSNSVEKFWRFLVDGDYPRDRGIEMGCGRDAMSFGLLSKARI